MPSLRPAVEADLDLIRSFVSELAEYEQLSHLVVDDREAMRAALFGPRPYAEVVIAEVDAAPAGFALFFHNFSTFLARPGLYLEDLFVRPAFRGRGVGKALLLFVGKLARNKGVSLLIEAVRHAGLRISKRTYDRATGKFLYEGPSQEEAVAPAKSKF